MVINMYKIGRVTIHDWEDGKKLVKFGRENFIFDRVKIDEYNKQIIVKFGEEEYLINYQ